LDELDNARAALSWAIERSDAMTAAHIVWGLWFLWLVEGHGGEARAAAERLLELELDPDEPSAFFGALGAGEILRITGNLEGAIEVKRHWLELGMARTELELFGESVGEWTVAILTDIAALECDVGDLASARGHAEEAVAIRRGWGRKTGIAHALIVLSEVALSEGNAEAAQGHLEEAVALYASAGAEIEILSTRVALGECKLICGRTEDAIAELRPIVGAASRASVYMAAEVARVVVAVAGSRGRYGESARLTGFHAEVTARAGLFVGSRERMLLERSQQEARARLADRYDATVEEGRSLELDEAIELMVDVLA
jgi:tetratricopeptide (TPR) repeat protein